MSKPEPLIEGQFYHIYNRGNNRETIFRTAENYRFFLKRYAHYIEAIAATYAYCLLPNHFHLLVRIRETQTCQVSETWQVLEPSKAFSNLFNSYTKAFNRRYDRTGSLFQKPFRRKRVASERYFVTLVVYIHQNAQRHGLVKDFRDWPWSSYGSMVSEQPTRVQRDDVLDWFGGRVEFVEANGFYVNKEFVAGLTGDD